eukprot:Hpha_TRINITY_DN16724_c0_g7::TRINITY_DN16724_c0_g7_i1::g.78627::m.78627
MSHATLMAAAMSPGCNMSDYAPAATLEDASALRDDIIKKAVHAGFEISTERTYDDARQQALALLALYGPPMGLRVPDPPAGRVRHLPPRSAGRPLRTAPAPMLRAAPGSAPRSAPAPASPGGRTSLYLRSDAAASPSAVSAVAPPPLSGPHAAFADPATTPSTMTGSPAVNAPIAQASPPPFTSPGAPSGPPPGAPEATVPIASPAPSAATPAAPAPVPAPTPGMPAPAFGVPAPALAPAPAGGADPHAPSQPST